MQTEGPDLHARRSSRVPPGAEGYVGGLLLAGRLVVIGHQSAATRGGQSQTTLTLASLVRALEQRVSGWREA